MVPGKRVPRGKRAGFENKYRGKAGDIEARSLAKATPNDRLGQRKFGLNYPPSVGQREKLAVVKYLSCEVSVQVGRVRADVASTDVATSLQFICETASTAGRRKCCKACFRVCPRFPVRLCACNTHQRRVSGGSGRVAGRQLPRARRNRGQRRNGLAGNDLFSRRTDSSPSGQKRASRLFLWRAC